MNTVDTLRIAAVQMCSHQNRDANLAQARALLEDAVQHDADLVALPENFAFLDREGEKLRVVEDLATGPSVQMLRAFAAEHNIVVVGGSIPMRGPVADKVTNTCLVFDASGDLLARYDKLHLFDVHLDDEHAFRESRYVAAGGAVVTFEAFGRTMGLSICYDLRFPELYRRLAQCGAQVLFIPSAFTMRTGKDHWEVLLRARAIENQCYVVAPAQRGRHNERRESYGNTMIVDPWGQVVARASDQDGVVVADLDFGYLASVRERLPALQHTRYALFAANDLSSTLPLS